MTCWWQFAFLYSCVLRWFLSPHHKIRTKLCRGRLELWKKRACRTILDIHSCWPFVLGRFHMVPHPKQTLHELCRYIKHIRYSPQKEVFKIHAVCVLTYFVTCVIGTEVLLWNFTDVLPKRMKHSWLLLSSKWLSESCDGWGCHWIWRI
jgi:hypothetical protein